MRSVRLGILRNRRKLARVGEDWFLVTGEGKLVYMQGYLRVQKNCVMEQELDFSFFEFFGDIMILFFLVVICEIYFQYVIEQ